MHLTPLQNPAPSPISQIGQAAGQFPMQQQSYEQAKAQTQDLETRSAIQRLAFLQQLLGTNEQARNSPQAIKTVTALYKQIGVPPPMTQGGQLDIAAMGVHAPWQTLLSDGANYAMAMALDIEHRDAWFSSHGIDPNTVPDQIRKASPYQVLTPNDATSIMKSEFFDIEQLGKGLGDIQNVADDINTFGPVVDKALGPGASANWASRLSANIGPFVQAKIEQAFQTGALDTTKRAEVNAMIFKLNAETDLTKKKSLAQDILNRWLPGLEQSRIDANESRIVSANAAASRAASYAQKITSDINQTKTLTPGSKEWSAQLGSIDKELSSMRAQQTAAEKLYAALGGLTNPTPAQTAELGALKTQISDTDSKINDLETGRKNLASGTLSTQTNQAPVGAPHAQGAAGEIWYYNGAWRYASGDPVS